MYPYSTSYRSLPDIRKCMKDNFNKCPHEVYVGLITSVSKVERACPYSGLLFILTIGLNVLVI